MLPPDVRFKDKKCAKINFGWGKEAPPQTPLGFSLQRSLRPQSGFKGATSKERRGERE